MLTETAPPPFTPSQNDELARHMRLAAGFGTDHAVEIEDAWRAALSHLEASLSLCLAPRGYVWRGVLDDEGGAAAPISPIRAITSAAKIGSDGETTLIDAALVRVEAGATGARFSAPSFRCAEIEIAFDAGFGDDWSATPASLRRAVLMLSSHYFDMRHAVGETAVKTPYGVDALVRPWSPMRLSLRAR